MLLPVWARVTPDAAPAYPDSGRDYDATVGRNVLLAWPLAQHVVTAGYFYNDGSPHNAIDLRAATGTPVYCAEDGTVDWVQNWDGRTTTGTQSYGNAVRIRHAD